MKAPYHLLIALRSDETILVVGGGSLAERKIATLLEAGCRPLVVSPAITDNLRQLWERDLFDWQPRKVEREDFTRRRLVLLALPPAETDRVLPWARQSGCLVNAASHSDEGDWALLAQFNAAGCRIGIGTGGTDPAKARRLKNEVLRHLAENEVKS